MLRWLIVAALINASVKAQLLTDSFDGTTLDASKWNSFEPPLTAGGGVGSVSVNSGVVVLSCRGTIITKQEFSAGLDLYGKFRFDGGTDRFAVYTRTTGISTNPWSEQDNGIFFRFQQDVAEVGIDEFFVGGILNPTGPYSNNESVHFNTLAAAPAELPSGAWLEFRIKDDGNQVELYLTDLVVPKIVAFSALRAGDKVALNNGYNPGQTVSVDYVTIVPEPTSISLLFASGAVLMAGRRRKQN